MKEIAKRENLEFGDNVRGFESETALKVFAANNTVGFGIVFHTNSATNNSLPADLHYEIMYNRTAVGNWNARYGQDPLYSQYNMTGAAITMQSIVDRAVIAVRGSARRVSSSSGVSGTGAEANVNIEMGLKAFPEVQSTGTSKKVHVVRQYGSLFFFGAVMFDFLLVLNLLVSEKERGLLGSMRKAGGRRKHNDEEMTR